ncbi:DoxX family protein [Hyphomicrobium sp. 99]|uniref:DoxX family protein n=1 Tax=Hyphomicrobium sp. 99 TaxID=1163419 RepID=UPI0005F8152E|nr:DoxX family protein [Hyphomicrobium sp. 99]
MNAIASLVGRVLLSAIFITAGINKISGYSGTQTYMESHGLPGGLLPVVIAFEVVVGLAVLLGIFSRWAGLLLAGFCLATAALFHFDFGDQAQATNFMKNLCMAGGFLLLFANGSGRYALRPD